MRPVESAAAGLHLMRFDLRLRTRLRAFEISAAATLLTRLFTRLLALFLGLLAVALRLFAAPSAMTVLVLRERRRGGSAGQKNGDEDPTHDSNFLCSLSRELRFIG
jgi:hypothetical protein